jgi:hypothetical protein
MASRARADAPQPRPARAEAALAPAHDEARLEAARQAEAKARKDLKTVMDDATTAKAAHDLAAKGLEELEESGDTCPKCLRPAWGGAAATLAQAKQELAEQARLLAAVVERGRAARGLHNDAQKALDAAVEAKAAHGAWRASLQALGPAPVLPASDEDGPPPPTVGCPTDGEVARARELVDAAQRAEGARQQREADLADARRKLSEAETARQAEADREARYDALVEVVRAAPSEVAKRQVQALGDLGPVTLVFGERPAVEVLIDARPWWLASRGRQVVGDMYLRGGLRHAMDLGQLPIVVDNVQDVGGQPIPDLRGPVVLLQTTHDSGLRMGPR